MGSTHEMGPEELDAYIQTLTDDLAKNLTLEHAHAESLRLRERRQEAHKQDTLLMVQQDTTSEASEHQASPENVNSDAMSLPIGPASFHSQGADIVALLAIFFESKKIPFQILAEFAGHNSIEGSTAADGLLIGGCTRSGAHAVV